MDSSDCVVEHFAFKIYTKFRVPSLFRYASKGKWEKIPYRCKTHPSEARFVHRYPPCDTALHKVLRNTEERFVQITETQERPLTVTKSAADGIFVEINKKKTLAVYSLVKANAHSASVQNCLGQTPLHLACADLSSMPEVFATLVEAQPQCASAQDLEGRTPLHCACRCIESQCAVGQGVPPKSNEIVQILLLPNPTIAYLEDKNRVTPSSIIHNLCNRLEKEARALTGPAAESMKRTVTVLHDIHNCFPPLQDGLE